VIKEGQRNDEVEEYLRRMSDPYAVEVCVTRPRFNADNFVPVLPVPKPTIADARRWLKAQGHQWTTTRHWRIVDRERNVIREFIPKGY
jgi:hypothetical protein